MSCQMCQKTLKQKRASRFCSTQCKSRHRNLLSKFALELLSANEFQGLKILKSAGLITRELENLGFGELNHTKHSPESQGLRLGRV